MYVSQLYEVKKFDGKRLYIETCYEVAIPTLRSCWFKFIDKSCALGFCPNHNIWIEIVLFAGK